VTNCLCSAPPGVEQRRNSRRQWRPAAEARRMPATESAQRGSAFTRNRFRHFVPLRGSNCCLTFEQGNEFVVWANCWMKRRYLEGLLQIPRSLSERTAALLSHHLQVALIKHIGEKVRLSLQPGRGLDELTFFRISLSTTVPVSCWGNL